ncbi:nickel pincer cofactor biosynthesis protein LarC [Desulfobacterales bacterium HSG17]|nr:nickel pincer cofactor biosynthesis protein LarC [Desulfobacterales bacterium HSG17]
MIAYFDIFSGISGDMTLGAFIDLGVPVSWIEKKLSNVLTGFKLTADIVEKNHIKATDIVVEIIGNDELSRNYKDIKALIEKSSLPEKVKKQSLTAFEKIAQAESTIHNKDIETIHFHEIGGVDSIVDIIGSFLCIEYLGIQKVYASVIPLGSGTVNCSHGNIPVPVPATMDILKNIPVKSSDATTEIVTPTGAAIITTLATSFGPMPAMKIGKTGYGSGKRDTGSILPNLLRIVLGDPLKAPLKNPAKPEKKLQNSIQKENIYVVKTNIDDMNPEISGFLMELLFDNNALDVCYIPVQMKKQRPGLQIEILCKKEKLDNIINIVLTETTSTGVRYHECERSFLLREKAFIQTRFGKTEVKKIINPDNSVRFVPEYDVAKKIAKQNKIVLKDVYNHILTDANPVESSHFKQGAGHEVDPLPLDRS